MNRSSSSPVRSATVTGLVSGLVVGLVVALVVAVALSATASTFMPSPSAVRHSKAGQVVTPALVARAALSAGFIAPGPLSGALATPANGRSGPFPGQVIPGFSAMVENGDGTFWAQPR